MKGNGTLLAGEPARTPLQAQTNPPDRILVVEDDIFFRRLNAATLCRSGYEVDTAPDGASAWQALNADSYDLLITDNSMPKVSGVELLKWLCAARMALPVIMATGTLPTKEFALYPWLQPAATLLKPYTGGEMLRTVKKVLREAYCAAADCPIVDMKNTNTSQAGKPASAPRQRLTGPAHRILVVDEDSDLRELYAEALADLGCRIDAAGDGAAGWEALRANRYELLITEHEIPNLTGVELVKMLRAARMTLPVVMAAQRLPTHELTRNPSLQIAATLTKPFTIGTLQDTVRNVLRATDSARDQVALTPSWRTQASANASL
jgi:DNA-binding response OmpR family regulator